MKAQRLFTIVLILTLLLALMPIQTVHAATITVNTTDDLLDAAPNCASVTLASLPGLDTVTSLREAICAANNNTEKDIIQFQIPGSGVRTIQPATALPVLTDDGTTIDGYTQGVASPATDTTPATLLIELDGRDVTNNNGLNIVSADNVIQGLIINRFSLNGIAIGGTTATGNVIVGNHIGTNAGGSTLFIGNKFNGIFIGYGAQNNVIGGNEPAERNVISGNELDGVGIHGSATMSNTVSGNYIGTNANGAADLGNYWHGVHVYGGAKNNAIGGNSEGEGNLISENGRNGVYIAGEETTGNVVSGNYIGLDESGLLALANFWEGVAITDGAHNNLIGPGNIISANELDGVYFHGAGTSGNLVFGNYIGTDASGSADLGNRLYGVYIHGGASSNVIGGDTDSERNIISGNNEPGVYISQASTTNNIIAGNYIGTDVSGTERLANSRGVVITDGAENNTIGGDTEGERNVISGNTGSSISISGGDTSGNVVSGNYLGTDASGTVALRSFNPAITIDDGANNNTIGGDTPGERNIIAGVGISSTPPAVRISGLGTINNTISGNYIGTDVSGTVSLENYGNGIEISEGARNNMIGGDTVGEGNLISGNQHSGINIKDLGTTNNVVSGNLIGTGATGTTALGNGSNGVVIWNGASDNTIGEGNLIAYNDGDGVEVNGDTTTRNTITKNSIYANTGLGINLVDGANEGIAPPNLTATVIGSVRIIGTSCPGCSVEVFANRDTDGEGEAYMGSAMVDTGGTFTVTVSSLPFPYLTATTTGATGTSEFSEAFTATLPILTTSTKVVSPTIAIPGGALTYTITLSNTGVIATPATMTDTLPTDVTWADYHRESSGTLTWNASNNRLVWTGTVNVGIPAIITYQVTVNAYVGDGTVIANTASVDDGAGSLTEIGPAIVTVIANKLYLPFVVP